MEKGAFEQFGTALSAFTPIFQPRQQRDNHETQKGVLNDPATRNSRRKKHRAVTAKRPILSVASISFSRIRRMHTLSVHGSSRPVNQYNRCCPTSRSQTYFFSHAIPRWHLDKVRPHADILSLIRGNRFATLRYHRDCQKATNVHELAMRHSRTSSAPM